MPQRKVQKFYCIANNFMHKWRNANHPAAARRTCSLAVQPPDSGWNPADRFRNFVYPLQRYRELLSAGRYGRLQRLTCWCLHKEVLLFLRARECEIGTAVSICSGGAAFFLHLDAGTVGRRQLAGLGVCYILGFFLM